jgi:uncharacterized membrane protein YfcA
VNELGPAAWLALTAIALGTSVVSGVMGLAGGMLLLAAMLHWMDPLLAIPVHGIVQLVSNASRAWFQRAHVRWDAVWRFAWPLLPAGALGLWLLRAIPPEAGRLAIGAFVLLATWAPGVLRWGAAQAPAPRAIRAARSRPAARWWASSARPSAPPARCSPRSSWRSASRRPRPSAPSPPARSSSTPRR